jgi:hypothetical protein
MRSQHQQRWTFLGLLFLGALVQPRASWRNTFAIATSGAPAQPLQGSIIFADQLSGGDMGAKIVAANLALGPTRGEIRVAKSGEISHPILLSQDHDLVCVGEVTLTMSTSQAKITQQSNTRVRGCTLSSTQVSPPKDRLRFFRRVPRTLKSTMSLS